MKIGEKEKKLKKAKSKEKKIEDGKMLRSVLVVGRGWTSAVDQMARHELY